jgi:hypothetical protein
LQVWLCLAPEVLACTFLSDKMAMNSLIRSMMHVPSIYRAQPCRRSRDGTGGASVPDGL